MEWLTGPAAAVDVQAVAVGALHVVSIPPAPSGGPRRHTSGGCSPDTVHLAAACDDIELSDRAGAHGC